MKLNFEVLEGTPRSASDKLSYQTAQYIGQLMQLYGIETISYSSRGKGYNPADIQLSFMDSPKPIQDVAANLAYPICQIMHEANLSKLSYTYSKDEVGKLKELWSKASEGIGEEELLVAPEVTPDMERIEIDL